jgi:hypothetical protein
LTKKLSLSWEIKKREVNPTIIKGISLANKMFQIQSKQLRCLWIVLVEGDR